MIYVSLLCCALLRAQSPTEANKLVLLDEVKIEGTRLPPLDLLKLTGLSQGQRVNDLIVNAACHQITATGLVKTVDYGYSVYPGKEGVVLVLTLVDEKPLLPAKIIPEADEKQLWLFAEQSDALLMRELPRTERAIAFYVTRLDGLLKALGRDNQYVSAAVTGDASGAPANITFSVRTYKQTNPRR